MPRARQPRTFPSPRRLPSRLRLHLALALVAACASVAARADTTAWIDVVRDDDRGLELVLRAPEPERVDGTLHVPGFSSGGDAGLPRIYARGVLVAVPGAAGARLEVLEEHSRREPGARPEIVPEPLSYIEAHSEDPLSHRVTRARAWRGMYPERSVSLHRAGRVRGRDAVQLRFQPLRFDDVGNAVYTRSVRVRLTFADRARPSGVGVAAVAEPMHASFLNARTAARWAARFDTQKVGALPEGAAAALPNERLRIRIARTGIYQLTYDRLQAAGVPVDQVNPTTFQIYSDTWHPAPLFADSVPASWQADYALQELALWVQGESDRSFDTVDRIVFYALGPYEYLDRIGSPAPDSLAHAQNPYDRFNYVWLVWEQMPGMRMQAASVPVVGTPPDLVTRSTQRYHFEQDRQFESADNLWVWEEIRGTRPALPQFDLDLAGEAGPVSGTLRIGISASSFGASGRHVLDVLLNNTLVGNIDWQQPNSRPNNAYFSFPVQLESSNDLRISIDTSQPSVSPRTLFTSLDVLWERPLVLPGAGAPDDGILRWSPRPVAANEAYEIAGFGANEPVALDVSDPAHPVRLTGMTPVGPANSSRLWRLRYGRGPGVRTHYAVVRTPVTVASTDLSLRMLPDLRNPTRTVPDMVIVTHATLRAQAERLAAHRAAHFPDDLGRAPVIEVVDVNVLYDHFSGGRVDPLAIRNYAKFLYTIGDPLQPPNLRYMLMFGEATHDPRRLLPSSTPTLVPTVTPWYAVPATRREYAVDDWLTEFDPPDPDDSILRIVPLPDIAAGRVTPRTSAEAQRIVDKFIAYDTSTEYGAWRTRLILAADDEITPRQQRESFHINNTEILVGLTPVEWDISKMYLTEFPAVLGQKPQARNAFIREWSRGCALINYQGHGAPRQIADEVLFLASDIPALSNGARLPVFMAFSCTVSEFDAPELQSMSEDMLTHTLGGAIASMGATTPTFASPNARYNEQVWREMFVDGAISKVPFGVIHQRGKNNTPEFFALNNETYVLIGDPSMTLLSPEYTVDLTSGTDSLEAGASSTVRGFVRAPGDPSNAAPVNGFADVEVFSSADESGYTKPDDPSFHIPYDLLGSPIYRSTVPVVGGRFQFSFVVPLSARRGNKARVSAYVWDPAVAEDAKGALNTVRLVVSAQPDTSSGAPRIVMRFPNNITKVKPGTPLIAEISDENGINIQGTTLPSSILLDFDDAGQQLNVTQQFRYDGSDTSGTLVVPLPDDLSPGQHKATLVAFDNLQNRSSESLQFDVVAGTSEQLVNVIAFPNPFRDRTYFFFEVTNPADVTVRVYTSSGREVWRTSQFVSEPQQVSIRWEGVDSANATLANGTYLYRIEARARRDAGEAQPGRRGPVLDAVGKVVIMRD